VADGDGVGGEAIVVGAGLIGVGAQGQLRESAYDIPGYVWLRHP